MKLNFMLSGRNLASSNTNTSVYLSVRRGYVCPLLGSVVTLSGVPYLFD